MKLVQKILSHGLLIVIILAAFFAYTKRDELFPELMSKIDKHEQQKADEKPSNNTQ